MVYFQKNFLLLKIHRSSNGSFYSPSSSSEVFVFITHTLKRLGVGYVISIHGK